MIARAKQANDAGNTSAAAEAQGAIRRLRAGGPVTATEYMGDLRSAYEFGTPSRFIRSRRINSNGANADYQLESDFKILQRIETAQDIAQNDVVVGSAVRGVVSNVIQGGMTLDPDSGSKELDTRLSEKWKQWSEKAGECDADGEHDFTEICQHALEAVIVAGDCLLNLRDDGMIEFIEAYRLRSPSRSSPKNDRIVFGVEYDATANHRKRIAYHVSKDDVFNMNPVHRKDLTEIKAFDNAGNRIALHLYRSRRKSQSRGVTMLAPIGAVVSMHDDINFAKLVQQQIVSCYAILREKKLPGPKNGAKARPQQGNQTTEVADANGFRRLLENIYPGMEIIGNEGEELKGFAPNVPNVEYFDHVRLMLTYIAVNLDIPLIVLLMDASQTNFSGWRGAWDQAKTRLVRWQEWLIKRVCRPVYAWKVRQWLAEDESLRKLADQEGVDPFRHKWQPPTWAYIQPMEDASSDLLQVRNCLSSARRIQAARGRDWNVVSDEIVADNMAMIIKCLQAVATIKKLFPEARVDWREVLSLPTPDSVTASFSLAQPQQGEFSGANK